MNDPRLWPELTAQQEMVGALLADGHTVREVAHILKLKEVTVRYHITQAALRIQSDLPALERLVVLMRSTRDLEVLSPPPGAALRCAMRLSKSGYRADSAQTKRG